MRSPRSPAAGRRRGSPRQRFPPWAPAPHPRRPRAARPRPSPGSLRPPRRRRPVRDRGADSSPDRSASPTPPRSHPGPRRPVALLLSGPARDTRVAPLRSSNLADSRILSSLCATHLQPVDDPTAPLRVAALVSYPPLERGVAGEAREVGKSHPEGERRAQRARLPDSSPELRALRPQALRPRRACWNLLGKRCCRKTE
jgi:hypothetical protein